MNKPAKTDDMKGFDSYHIKLGDVMRGERATLGKSLLDVQRDLRIKAAYISAIENCDPSAFQTPGFIAGYVRSYARYLNLDPETTFAQFCIEAGFDGVHPGISRTVKPIENGPVVRPAVRKSADDPLSKARLPLAGNVDGVLAQVSPSGMGSIMVLAALILGLGYGAWAVLQDIQRVDFTPAEDSELAQDAPLDVANLREDTEAIDRLYRPRELEVPVMTPRDGPISELDPERIGALVEANGTQQARDTAALMSTEAPRVTEMSEPVVQVVAAQAAWIRVSAADGAILFERILDAGQSFQLPLGAQASSLRAGNSGAVFLSVDGVAYGPVGRDTGVVRDVALAGQLIPENFSRVEDASALAQIDSPTVITLNQTDN